MVEAPFRELQRIAHFNECSVCGGMLTVAYLDGVLRLRCGNDKAHEGHRKIKSLGQMYDEGENLPIDIANAIERKRRRQVEAQETRLARYQGVTSLSKADAEMVLRTIWPKAPDPEVLKAALVCRDYGLNPLMKHVFLIPFKEQWAMVLGIGAKRLIASREGGYTYADGPRIMTEAEQKGIRGEVDDANWWAITVVERKGARYPGYGSWPRDKAKAPYGGDKGNTAQNMAFIRSESAALQRLAPGGFPPVDVVDEAYVESSARVIEAPQPEALQPQAQVLQVAESPEGHMKVEASDLVGQVPGSAEPKPAVDRPATERQKETIFSLQGKLGDSQAVPAQLTAPGAEAIIKRLNERLEDKQRRVGDSPGPAGRGGNGR